MHQIPKSITAGLLLVVTAIVQVIFDRFFEWTMIFLLPFSLSDIILIVGLIIGAILIGVGFWSERKEITVDPHFAYLTVWYSDSRDTPETEKPHRPYFIANRHTKQAYHVSDLITPYVKKRTFQFNTKPSKSALLTYFKKQGITPNHNNPEPGELGLIFNKDGSLTPLPKIIYELKNLKLHDLEILWLFPWYRQLLPARCRYKRPHKQLLRKFSTKETYKPPHYGLELVKIGKIAKDNKIMKRGDHLKDWSERNGYTYINRRFNDEDLLAEE